jgi:hypothetical protein
MMVSLSIGKLGAPGTECWRLQGGKEMTEQKSSLMLDPIEHVTPTSHPGDWVDEEPVSWETAWIDIGGEG